jgi:hypothetical protein
MPTIAGPDISTDGLTFYIDASNSRSFISGSAPVTDMQGNSPGECTTTTMFNDINQGVWNFDGIDEAIDIPTSASFGLNNTLIMWWKFDGSAGGYVLDGGAISGDEGINLNMYSTDSTVYTLGTVTKVFSGVRSAMGYDGNTWGHLAIVRSNDGDKVEMFVNGVSMSSNTGCGSVETMFFSIGRNKGSTHLASEGDMALMQGYTRALSDEEVVQNYNALKGRFS